MLLRTSEASVTNLMSGDFSRENMVVKVDER